MTAADWFDWAGASFGIAVYGALIWAFWKAGTHDDYIP